MNFATPGSRSANYTSLTLGFIVAGTAAGLFALVAIIFWFFGASPAGSFIGHWMKITMPGWPATVIILAATQAIRTIATQNTGRSWPWVIVVFAAGFAADFLVMQNDRAANITRVEASGIIAAIVYIFFFTRWFSGK
jgi:hypothetical protein